MGFENNVGYEANRRSPGEHPVVAQMHEKAVALLDADALNPLDFKDHYGAEVVQQDLNHIAHIKESFVEDENKRAAEVLEAILYEHTELSDWLGPNAKTIRPSEYDDIVNGIDLIVEFESEDATQHLALGVDITFGSISMTKKFDRIHREIEEDDLARIKYFESHGFKGSLKQLPRVVIGVEKETVIELASLWMRHKNRELGTHKTKDIVVEEIKEQLKTFLAFARAHKKENAVKSYAQAFRLLNKLHVTLREQPLPKDRLEEIAKDKVFDAIKNQLQEKFSV